MLYQAFAGATTTTTTTTVSPSPSRIANTRREADELDYNSVCCDESNLSSRDYSSDNESQFNTPHRNNDMRDGQYEHNTETTSCEQATRDDVHKLSGGSNECTGDQINGSNETINLKSQQHTSDNEGGDQHNSCLGGNDEDSNRSSASNSHPPSESPQRSLRIAVFISQHRKKIGTLLASVLSMWLYSQYKQSLHRGRRQDIIRSGNRSNDNKHLGRVLGIYRLALKLLSPVKILSFFRQMISRKLTSGEATSTATSLQTLEAMKHATTTPLSHLLALAKSGNVSKVMLRGSTLSYLHSMQASTPQNANQQQRPTERWSKTTLPSQNQNVFQEIVSTLLNNGCDDISTLPESLWRRFLNGPAIVVFPFAYLGALYYIMRRLQRQQFEDDEGSDRCGPNKSMSTQRSTATFDDVAGIDSALQELSEVISYLRHPDAFHTVGASPPRGILLHGPPGSGKTLLARAIAGEAGRSIGGVGSLGLGATVDSFVVCSGSDFVETYVGRGAARVRALFRGVREEAWRNFERRQRQQTRLIDRSSSCDVGVTGKVRGGTTLVGDTMMNAWEGMQTMLSCSRSNSQLQAGHQSPMAIIFIDEIDALAKRRDTGMGLPSSLGGGGCDEREQTLNQLLTEMDGFATGSSSASHGGGPPSVIVIVIAATNRPECLDPAILRAGRFDRHVKVPLPDARGREAILRVHSRNIRWDQSSVNFGELAGAPTNNFSGADLKNVTNEAALLAVRSKSLVVKQHHLLEAVQKVKSMINNSPGGEHISSSRAPTFFVR